MFFIRKSGVCEQRKFFRIREENVILRGLALLFMLGLSQIKYSIKLIAYFDYNDSSRFDFFS